MGIRPIPPQLQEKAIKELNEDPSRLAADVQHIKDWIAKQPHIKARTDDQWILAFLRGCKYSLERAKVKIDNFYTMYTLAPEFVFKLDLNGPIFKEIVETAIGVALTKSSDSTRPRVFIMKPGDYSTERLSIMDIFATMQLTSKLLMLEDDQACISGIETIIDLENVTLAHMTAMTPSVIKKMVVFSQDASPFRQKGTHYINTPPGFETVFNLFKSFMNEKNRSRLYVHNKDMDSLYKAIPKADLPTEYGGEAGTVKEAREYWRKRILENSEFIAEELSFGTDEAKRPGKPRTGEALFGLDGSFRQLSVD